MRNLNLREEMTEKEEPILISTEKVKRPCKSKSHRPSGTIKYLLHTKEVFSDGWTKWVCSHPDCGQVKYTKGITFEEEK